MPGCVFVSSGALDALSSVHVPHVHFLIRHMRGDWGRLSDEDWQRNERALVTGDYLLSSYILSSGQKIWLHTTGERSATFVLLPAEAFRLERSLRDALLGR
ncbi:putative type I restriction-modification system methyltransferase subunit [Burkholderia pseudomallei NCTC 13179]|nr:putative type I restriction-modification system methyltransferase subunit [Burkholderia pseudomallei NCTC 13179]